MPIHIDPILFETIKASYPDDENALLTMELLINEICINFLPDKYFIRYTDSITGKTETISYKIKTAIATQLIYENTLTSIEIFKASLIAQIGTHNNKENIIEYIPPPILFIELWRYNENVVRNTEYSPFSININGSNFEYQCVGVLIHSPDHFKSVVFDNGLTLLYDDELVVDLYQESEGFNVFQQIELQHMQYHSVMLVFQVKNDQFEELISI